MMNIANQLILTVVYRKGNLGPIGQPVDFSITDLDNAKIEKMLNRGSLGLRWLLAGVDSEDTAAPCQLGKGRMMQPISPEDD